MLWTDFMWMRRLCLDFKGLPQFGQRSSGRITCFPSICRDTSVLEAKVCGQILQAHLLGPVSWLTEQFSLMNPGSWSRERWTGALVYPRKKCLQLTLIYSTSLFLCLFYKFVGKVYKQSSKVYPQLGQKSKKSILRNNIVGRFHMHPHGVTGLSRLVANVTVLRRKDNVLGLNVSLYVTVCAKKGPT